MSNFDALLDIYDQMAARMQLKSLISHVINLDDLADVDVEVAASGQVLSFDGVDWLPSTGIPGLALATISDSAPPTGQNGQFWFNQTTNELRIWYQDGWERQTLDDGQY